ncbi:DUF2507 domain-containing protein [Weissella halotolerans]|uniref:DUF2507 domain-containing protein n=1 Tax=Weissella halotolerans DSM 20190 TaxID=1123500 RepID=A0A0R2G7U4_9LACO|nr:DUF2507 domain-containing protein [Weissella halotolerans]KRN33559.1 hypothetical protein IV68_GL000365 [Weissella halotolerans DSM 20190]
MVEQRQAVELSPYAVSVLRDELLPELLQDDEQSILYWAGKSLARRQTLRTLTDIQHYFQRAGFGDLTLVKESKTQLDWQLSGRLVADRLAKRSNANFTLESGFLAQAIQELVDCGVEAMANPEVSQGVVNMTVLTEAPVQLEH